LREREREGERERERERERNSLIEACGQFFDTDSVCANNNNIVFVFVKKFLSLLSVFSTHHFQKTLIFYLIY
jgi:hypothetical protein